MSEEIPIVTDMIRGYLKSQIVRTIATLSIADLLAKGPASLGDLVEKTGADPDGLERLLRAAVTLGFVVYAEGQYRATARLEVLREDAPMSLKYLAIGLAGPSSWGPCGRLPEAVKTGAVQSTAALGRPVFEHFAANPQEAADFMRFMQAASDSAGRAIFVILAKATRSTQHWQSSVPSSVLVSLIPLRPSKKERRERTVPPLVARTNSINLVA